MWTFAKGWTSSTLTTVFITRRLLITSDIPAFGPSASSFSYIKYFVRHKYPAISIAICCCYLPFPVPFSVAFCICNCHCHLAFWPPAICTSSPSFATHILPCHCHLPLPLPSTVFHLPLPLLFAIAVAVAVCCYSSPLPLFGFIPLFYHI